MFGKEQLERLWSNLLALGAMRLAILAGVGVAIFGTVGLGSYYLSRPDLETLYSGLNSQDVSRIGAALTEAGIAFDVSSDGTKVLVHPGKTAQARMLLAEKGLPSSATAGYELFDKLGSMGLTSFMQEVTRVRALEGELARTIQTLKGVKAARVHIVLADSGSFRRDRQQPSASVIIRTDLGSQFTSAPAIRHLVAAAVPALSVDQVKVLSTDGTVLASESDSLNAMPSKMIELEKTVSEELQEKIKKTLGPYLGKENFEISVSARLNIDKRQTNETVYDPKSRIERSVRVIKEIGNQQNSTSKPTVGVEQNLPEDQGAAAAGESSKKNNERKEELTNFEISTKTTATESQGFRIEKLTVAVLVNRKRVAENASPAVTGSLEERLKEVEQLVKSAAGIDDGRGDQVTVAAVEFAANAPEIEPEPVGGVTVMLMDQAGSLIRSLTILAVTALLLLFGVRPVMRALLEQPAETAAVEGGILQDQAALPAGAEAAGAAQTPLAGPINPDSGLLADLTAGAGKLAEKRLEALVEVDEVQAAAILKQWLREALP